MLERMKRVVMDENADRALCRQHMRQLINDTSERMRWIKFGGTEILAHRDEPLSFGIGIVAVTKNPANQDLPL